MKSQREFAEECRDSWAESARHDRTQFLASFAIAATGVGMVGFGIRTALDGDVYGGVYEIGVGGAIATAFGKIGLGEVRDFAETTAKAEVWRNRLDELPE